LESSQLRIFNDPLRNRFGCVTHLLVMKSTDTVTLTLKNISPHLHRTLKAQAKRHKRSLNQEAILCLEHAVVMDAGRPSLATPPPPVSVGTILQPWSSRSELVEGILDREDDAR
jgi:hypothetical protein